MSIGALAICVRSFLGAKTTMAGAAFILGKVPAASISQFTSQFQLHRGPATEQHQSVRIMSHSVASEFQSSAGSLLKRVKAGLCTIGSSESEDGHRVWEQQREVTFENDFYLGETPVTQAQYEAVTGTNPTDHETNPNAPVDSVNWVQAMEYCGKLTQLDRDAGLIPVDWEYRLPTESEWEFTCRAGSSQARHGQPGDVAWHHDNADNRPHSVGQKMPNSWGFYDMLGNVWEWCQDWFYRANPCRSARGGSYFNSAAFCRSAKRWGWNPKSRGRYSGFRLLAAAVDSFDLSPPIDDFPAQKQPPSIYDAIDVNDFDLAFQIVTADPGAIESVDAIPPPLHNCIYADNAEMLEWLLDHGANIERPEQDYGSPPLNTAVVMRRKKIIQTLVKRGADTSRAMDRARRGLAGEFEDDPSLDRNGYKEIVELLQELGVETSS